MLRHEFPRQMKTIFGLSIFTDIILQCFPSFETLQRCLIFYIMYLWDLLKSHLREGPDESTPLPLNKFLQSSIITIMGPDPMAKIYAPH